jgi:zinc/manganese transport system permease protein
MPPTVAWWSWASPTRRPITTTVTPTTVIPVTAMVRPTDTAVTPKLPAMAAEILNPHLSWNLARDVSEALEYHFMVNALLAGSIVAIMAGLVGWFMVLRRDTFAGHTLSMMAFPGASGAALLGIPAAWGYFVFCGAGALAIGRLPRARGGLQGEQSAAVGAVQALALAIGFLFVSLYGGVLGDLENLLFGTFIGISDSQVLALLAVAAGTLAVLGALARPLLFASVDAGVAGARGVPVRALASAFLLLLGLAVAATSQITGVLLVFALLVTPAATAQAITARPLLSLLLTVALGLLVVWLGLGIAYFSVYPAGFFITTISFATYVLARTLVAVVGGRSGDHLAPPSPAAPPRGVID